MLLKWGLPSSIALHYKKYIVYISTIFVRLNSFAQISVSNRAPSTVYRRYLFRKWWLGWQKASKAD